MGPVEKPARTCKKGAHQGRLFFAERPRQSGQTERTMRPPCINSRMPR
jgi:hypothetical protein